MAAQLFGMDDRSDPVQSDHMRPAGTAEAHRARAGRRLRALAGAVTAVAADGPTLHIEGWALPLPGGEVDGFDVSFGGQSLRAAE